MDINAIEKEVFVSQSNEAVDFYEGYYILKEQISKPGLDFRIYTIYLRNSTCSGFK